MAPMKERPLLSDSEFRIFGLKNMTVAKYKGQALVVTSGFSSINSILSTMVLI